MRKYFEKIYPWANYLIWMLGLGVELMLAAFSGKPFIDFSEKNFANSIITILFFVFTAIVLIKAQRELNRGRNLIKSINDFMDYIKGRGLKAKIIDDIIGDIENISSFIQDEKLKEAIRDFVDDSIAIREESPELCANIENYVNYELLEADIKAHFQNQVSGTMTGLGILGTFLGLSIGLNSFNLSTQDSGQNEESIKSLMEGIKVAFHTSIVGLIYSLLFNFIYRSQLVVFQNKIDELCTLFTKRIIPLSKNGSDESFISYQDKMLKIMNMQYELQKDLFETQKNMNSNIGTLSSNVGIGFTQVDKHLSQLSSEISSDITSIMRDTVVPEMKQLGIVIKEFADNTTDTQDKAMREIVDNFIKHMDDALGKSFDDLKDVLIETTEVQRNSNKQMSMVIDEIMTSVTDLNDINKVIENAIIKIENYTEEVEEMQDKVNECIDNLNIQINLSNENIITQTNTLDEIKETEKDVLGTVVVLTSNVKGHIEALAVTQNQVLDNIKEQNKVISNTTSGINEALISTTREINETLTNTNTIINKRAIEELAVFKDAITDITEESQETLRNSYTNTVTELLKTIDSINSVENGLSNDLSTATKAMVEATSKLNNGLEKRISNVFDQIDTDLADIMSRFSATILSMKETLNKTSTAIEFTYVDIDKTFEEMHKNLEGYMVSATKLHRSMDSILNQVMQENTKRDD